LVDGLRLDRRLFIHVGGKCGDDSGGFRGELAFHDCRAQAAAAAQTSDLHTAQGPDSRVTAGRIC
jgi:hypothetical protein